MIQIMRQNILIFLLLPVLLSSCVYFNTFHNTKKYYNEARKEREKRPEADKATSQELRKYDETIEKASKILELYSDSKYVDDALFILGECFYYKQNYVKAQRKFIELSQYFPDSDYYPKARLWLAKTNTELKDYSSAKLILTTLLDTPKLNKNIKYEALYQLGEIEFLQEFYTEAKDILLSVTDEASNKETRARSLYRLGECRLQLEEYNTAVDDFYNAMRNSPDRRFKFDATLNYARALKLSGSYDEAKDVCAALLSNELYKKLHGWAQLEMADCIYLETKQRYAQASPEDYYNKLLDVLEEFKIVTLENKRTEVAAHAFFQMGTIYETELIEFANAKDSFNKVKAEYGRCELVPDAVKKAKDIDDLIRLSNLVKKAQGEQLLAEGKGSYNLSSLELLLLEHGNGPELRFMKFQRENGVAALDSTELEERNRQQEDELVKNKLQLAETYMFQFNQVDSALFEYDEIIELFPEHTGVVNALYSTAYIYENEFQDDNTTDSLLSVIIERYPESEQAQDARVRLGLRKKQTPDEIASQLFASAEEKLFDGKLVQYAMADYQRIVDEYPETQ